MRYTDPSGHCIPCIVIAGAIVATPLALSALGFRSDVEGVMTATAVTMYQDSDILVTAGIAVQSQALIGTVGGGETGWAQASSDELNGKNPFSASASVEVMNNRIYNSIDACKQCNSAVDKLVVAALAQNGFDFDPKEIGQLPVDSNNNIAWGDFLRDFGQRPSAWHANLRGQLAGRNYDTQLMLKIYIQDLLLLKSMGYELPDWLSEEDIQTIVKNNYFYKKQDVENEKTPR